MKIAIEAQRIYRKEKHGMDYVALEMIRELQKLDHENEYYILVCPGKDRCLEESDNMHIVEVKCISYPLWEQVALPLALKKIQPDILHCTSNTAPIFCKVPLVLTLHDIIFLEKKRGNTPSFYQKMGRIYRRLVVPRILKKCKKIITVSQFERNHINTSLGLEEGLLEAVYNGYSKHFHPIEETKDITRKYLNEDEYFFFLGNTDPKKNTEGVLKAYALYMAQSKNPLPLLIADLSEDTIDAYLKANQIMHIKPQLRFPGYIANTELPAIYSGATAFIYTSYRESFGIPILEAMACGTPVITSNTSAMPEIAGNNGILIDPYQPKEIADELLHLEKDETYRNKQIVYGLERVKLFSWENTAKNVLDIYKKLKL